MRKSGNNSTEENWTIEGIILSGNYADPDVVELSDGSYRLYFMASDIPGIMSATSTNGTTWSTEEGTRIGASVWPEVVSLSDGRFRLYYEYQSEIKSAISSDGLTFTEEAGVRLATGSASAYDHYAIQGPSIITLSDGSYRMYYQGCTPRGDGRSDVLYLSAVSNDGLTWTKESGIRVDGRISPFDDTIVEESITTQAAIKMPDGSIRLYFKSKANTSSEDSGIHKALSTDGLNFTVYITPEVSLTEMQASFSDQGGDPCVIRLTDGRYRMFFSRSNLGIISAISNNF